jgi:excisionase family DNA binding protein
MGEITLHFCTLLYKRIQNDIELGEMSVATFKVNKICKNCNRLFEAQKVTTKFCSHKCSKQNYKLRAKLAKKGEAEKEIHSNIEFKPKVNAVNLELVRQKDFLTVREIAALFGCSKPTVYKLINSGKLKATNILEKKTLILRSDIDRMFDHPEEPATKILSYELSDCYNILDVQKKYNVSYNGLNAIIKRNNIPKQKNGIYTYVPKSIIDKIFINQ